MQDDWKRDPIWQFIGVLISVLCMFITIYTLSPDARTPVLIMTAIVFIVIVFVLFGKRTYNTSRLLGLIRSNLLRQEFTASQQKGVFKSKVNKKALALEFMISTIFVVLLFLPTFMPFNTIIIQILLAVVLALNMGMIIVWSRQYWGQKLAYNVFLHKPILGFKRALLVFIMILLIVVSLPSLFFSEFLIAIGGYVDYEVFILHCASSCGRLATALTPKDISNIIKMGPISGVLIPSLESAGIFLAIYLLAKFVVSKIRRRLYGEPIYT